MSNTEYPEYDQQAQDFLQKHDLTLKVTPYPDDMQEPPEWADGEKLISTQIGSFVCGLKYRITIYRNKDKSKKLTFDFWGSIKDRETLGLRKYLGGPVYAGPKQLRAEREAFPSAYDVLACISGDLYCPNSFEDFCGEYGYDSDSRKAEKIFNLSHAFSKKMVRFFSPEEVEELSEIR